MLQLAPLVGELPRGRAGRDGAEDPTPEEVMRALDEAGSFSDEEEVYGATADALADSLSRDQNAISEVIRTYSPLFEEFGIGDGLSDTDSEFDDEADEDQDELDYDDGVSASFLPPSGEYSDRHAAVAALMDVCDDVIAAAGPLGTGNTVFVSGACRPWVLMARMVAVGFNDCASLILGCCFVLLLMACSVAVCCCLGCCSPPCSASASASASATAAAAGMQALASHRMWRSDCRHRSGPSASRRPMFTGE